VQAHGNCQFLVETCSFGTERFRANENVISEQYFNNAYNALQLNSQAESCCQFL
jgi:hypothetical protein